jgi:hypothetical protein
MDQSLSSEISPQLAEPESPDLEVTSTSYVGRWNRLVSTTNWEKGRIILEWRCRLMEAGAPPQAYSDEAWSRRVGHVSPQHVGRLRRVAEQFGEVYRQYEGLYWSHFHAALDWNDAEMWLEGAVQNGWSVAQMRTTRWEATGAAPDQKPDPDGVVAAESDEDVDAALDEPADAVPFDAPGVVRDVDSGATADDEPDEPDEGDVAEVPRAEAGPTAEPVRPFEGLAALPDDLAEAFESFKLALLNHKVGGWKAISRDQVLAALDALKQLALAPADG